MKVLGLGNSASVGSVLSRHLPFYSTGFGLDRLDLSNDDHIRFRDEMNLLLNDLAYPYSIRAIRLMMSLRERFDLFHSELYYGLPCLGAGARYGICIAGSGDLELLSGGNLLSGLVSSVYRPVLQNALYVVASPYVAPLIRPYRRDLIVIDKPVDFETFRPTGPATRFPAEDLSFLSPGRMDGWKGHDLIWSALRIMKNRGRVTVFQIDHGPEAERIRSSAPQNVRFIPPVPRKKVAELYRGADVVLGQMRLGFPSMVEREAAACGRPVTIYVNSRYGKQPFLPKEPSAETLAETLDRLVEDAGFRSEYADACRAYTIARCDPERIAESYAKLWAGAVAGEPRRVFLRQMHVWWMGSVVDGSSRLLHRRMAGPLAHRLYKSALDQQRVEAR